MGRLILIGGGSRSGKSAFALTVARRMGERRVYLATAEALDEEMAERIASHQKARGRDFDTVEEPTAVPKAVARLRDYDVVVLDCLTFWISNLLSKQETPSQIEDRIEELLGTIARASAPVIVVTNEVGMGLVPETPLGRTFRDVSGRAHQRLAKAADEVYFAALGTILKIKPSPLLVETS